jgi:uncharacterized protein
LAKTFYNGRDAGFWRPKEGGMENKYPRSKGVIYKFALLLMVMLFSLLVGSLRVTETASFECEKAKTWIEKLICEDEDLTDLDRKMSASYKELISFLSPQDKREVKENQIEWLKARDKACNIIKIDEAVRSYLDSYYSERIAELKDWEQYTKHEGLKKGTKPWKPKCWKRQPIMDPDSAAMRGTTGNADICRVFEQLLETICEPPEKFKCTYNLLSDETRFKKLIWEDINPKEYPGVVDDLTFGEEHNKEKLRAKDPNFVQAYTEGKIKLVRSVVDIDNDGRLETIVKMNWRQNCPASGKFGLLNPITKRLDRKYNSLLQKMNDLVDTAEIFIYKERTYTIAWDNGYKRLYIWDGEASYNQKICEIKYLGGGKR